MLKNKWIWLVIGALYFSDIWTGDFLPDFIPLPDVGVDANIDSFPITGVVNLGDSSVINSIAIDNSNRIVAAGFVNVGFNTNWILARYNSDGSLDTTFNANGPQPGIVVTNAYNNMIPSGLNSGTPASNGNQAINNIVIDNNNKIVVVGYVNDGTNNFFTVGRYNSNGTLDTSFSPQGTGTNVPGTLITNIESGNETATAVIIDSNNKIVVTGYSQITGGQTETNYTDIALVRYNNDGSLDTTLNPDGLISDQPGVVITNVTGSPQTTITGNNNWAFAITIDNDNRILVGGAANITEMVLNSSISESTGSLVIRYNPDGSLDTTFNASGVQYGPPGSAITVVNNTDKVTSVKIDNNNKIVLTGYSTFPTNDAGQGDDLFIIRYNEDGSYDITLNPGALLPPSIAGIITTDIPGYQLVGNSGFIDNNNNIVIGGWISNQLSNFEVMPTNVTEVDFLVVRYLPSGVLDTTFNTMINTSNSSFTPILFLPGFVVTSIPNQSAINGFLPNAQGNSVVLDNNNNIVLAGFSTSGPEKDFTLARYTNAGILDTTNFNPNGIISKEPGVVIIDATGGSNPYNVSGVALTLSTMTDVINLPNIAVDSERAAEISSFFVGFSRPFIEAPLEILKDDDSELVLAGTAHPHSTVHLAVNGITKFSFKATSEGSWRVAFPSLSDGNYHVYATSTDPLSHLSFTSNSVNVIVKKHSYIAPSIIRPTVNEYFDTRVVNAHGSGEPSGPILLFLNAKFVGQTKADNEGNWEYEFNDLPDGKYLFNVIGFDNLGHPNRKSPVVNFFVDRVPVTPKINNPQKDQTITVNYVNASGAAKPFGRLSILLNDKEIGNVMADDKGNWRVKLKDLDPKDYALQVIARGAKRLPSDTVKFKVKKQPIETSPLNTSTEGITPISDNVMSINGMLKPNKNIKLLMNGDHLADIKSDHVGLWKHQLPLSSVPEGDNKVQYALLDKNNKLKMLVERPVLINKLS